LRVWSSVHFFTDKTRRAIRECTLDLPDAAHERDAVETYVRNCRELWGREGELPLHDTDRHFMDLFRAMYPQYVPAWVIQRDFEKKGLHLNLRGDLICSPGVVSAFSSRYFGGPAPEGTMFHNLRDMARDVGCPVLNHTLILDGERALCKVYLARGKELAMLSWGMEGHENRNASLPEAVFPALRGAGLTELKDALEASRRLCAALDIPEGGPDYERRREESCRFLRTEKLCDIYIRGRTAPIQ